MPDEIALAFRTFPKVNGVSDGGRGELSCDTVIRPQHTTEPTCSSAHV